MEKNLKLLKSAGSSILKAPHGSDRKDKKVNLYKLNLNLPKDAWKGFSLPPKYDKIVDEALFAIPRKAMDTIEYLLAEAPVQRYMPLYFGYDTSVRETLMEIGAEFVHKAIYLICDYYYDSETQYYSRVGDNDRLPSWVLKTLAIYKFWNGRTGRALPWSESGLDDYKYSDDKNWCNYYYVSQEIKNYEKIQEMRWELQEESELKFDEDKKQEFEIIDSEEPERHIYEISIVYDIFNFKIFEPRFIKKYEIEDTNERDAKIRALNKFYHEFCGDLHAYQIEEPIDVENISVDVINITKARKELREYKFNAKIYFTKLPNFVWDNENKIVTGNHDAGKVYSVCIYYLKTRTLEDFMHENTGKIIVFKLNKEDNNSIYFNNNRYVEAAVIDDEEKEYGLKTNDRFVVEFPEEFKIAPYTVKKINAPVFDTEKRQWENFVIELLDPVHPSASKGIFELIQKEIQNKDYMFSFVIKTLDPAGMVIEKWKMSECKIDRIHFGDNDYGNGEVRIIHMSIKPGKCILSD